VVQSAAHGFDHSAAADFLADHPGSYVGVALAPVNADMADLKKLHGQGFRGVRFNFVQHLGGAPALADLMKLATKLAVLDWHLQLYVDPSMILKMTPELKLSPVPVVIDHMGRIDASHGLDQPGFTHLLKLMEDKRFWVKVCGAERISRAGPPFHDALPFARTLVERFPERVLWGTDWPHPNIKKHMPDDGALVDLLAEIAPSTEHLHKLLVGNPRRLYWPEETS
jgi:2-pyrone-4,6-dicarboxylate lactonase